MRLPGSVLAIMRRLKKHGFKSYVVGGSVRDSLLGSTPHDWDVATDATPDEVEALFKDTIPTGKKYGTITVKIHNDLVEVTTFRADGEYKDGRRPETVTFSEEILDDLQRRDFTINAMAYDPFKREIIDPFNGQGDIMEAGIRAVGTPEDRFNEDALRMLRAVRFATILDFDIEPVTFKAIFENADLIQNVSAERVRDELSKILLADKPSRGMKLLLKTGLMEYLLPDIGAMSGVEQNKKWHSYDVFDHTMGVLDKVPAKLPLRLAALFHDSGKPQTRTVGKDGNYHFYGHEEASALIAEEQMTALKFPISMIEEVKALVLNHMFQFDRAKNKRKTMRRVIAALNKKADIYDLIALRAADRSKLSRGPKYEDYDITPMVRVVEQIFDCGDALYLSDLAVNGKMLIEEAGIPQGPYIGQILDMLMKSVLSNPNLNEKENLLKMAAGEYRQLVKESKK